ncbi:MAG: hypothetical protein JZU52_11715 [Lamprocystis purpurea]|jgi:hypothetical protein|nr:hypothetical protein [Lamprocystis purpurea]
MQHRVDKRNAVRAGPLNLSGSFINASANGVNCSDADAIGQGITRRSSPYST